MAWEWATPAATALVGVASIAGTSWIAVYNSRRSRETTAADITKRHELEMRNDIRRERQRLYGDFLAAEREAHARAFQAKPLPEMIEQRVLMESLGNQIRVLGSQRTGDLVKRLVEHAFLLEPGGFIRSDPEGKVLTSLRDEVVESMRRDVLESDGS